MSDIRLAWDPEKGFADFAIVENDLESDEGLETSVFISLFTKRRAEDSDQLPGGQTSLQGWWADSFASVQGDKIGSRLWLLAREKSTSTVLRLAQEYAAESLQWMVDDRVAASFEVSVASLPLESGRNMLVISVNVVRPTGEAALYRYQYNWIAQEARRS